MNRIGKFLAMMVAALAVCEPLAAQQKFENLDRIDGLVATTVGANIGQPGGAVAPVDRRLRLAACPQMPDVSGPQFGAAVVKCDPLGWRIRVPLAPGGNVPAAPAYAAQRPAVRAAAAPGREIVIRKGDPVQLIADGPSFTASRAMIADEDGAVGQMIRVREDRKSDPVVARVQEYGIVRAAGFNNF